MMTDAEMQDVGAELADSIRLVRQQLLARGRTSEIRSSYDEETLRGWFSVVVGEQVVFTLTIDHSDPEHAVVLRRWDSEALRQLGMGDIARVVERRAC